MKKLIALLLFPLGCFAQSGNPFSNNVFPAQSFTATAQTGAVIQLNGQQLSYGAGTISLTGTSLTTATIAVMGSSDNGLTYYALPISVVSTPGVTPTTTVTATASGLYQVSLVGITHVKFVTSGTFTATSVSLVLTATPNFAISRSGGPGGGASFPNAAGIGYPLKSLAAGTTYAAQSPIALDPRDYGADFCVRCNVADATTTNGSNVVTCPNSDCGFPSNIASASYIIFATAGNGSSCLDNPSILFGGARQTIVTGFTNANSITVSGNSDTTGTATVCLAWFPKDSTTALNAWWLAGGCTGVYQMPAGNTLFSAPIMQFIPGCPLAVNAGLGYPGQTVLGAGLGSTFLIPAPVFTYTPATGQMFSNVCVVGNKNVEDSENFEIFGLGERATGALAATCLFVVGDASRAVNIDLVGWDARGGGSSLVGAYMEGVTDFWSVGGSNFFGSIEMYMANYGQLVLGSFTSGNNAGVTGTCGFRIAGAGQVTVIGNTLSTCSQVDVGTVMTSTGTQFIGAAGDTVSLYANGGRMYLLGNDFIGLGGLNYSVTGSSVFAQGATFASLTGISGGYFFDNGGNVFNGTTTLNGLIWPQSLSVVGVPPAAGNLALGAGWGASATASIATNPNDERHFTFTLTNGASGVAQATATIAYTFPRGFQIAPGLCRATQIGGTNPALTLFTSTAQTTAAVTFTAQSAPTISSTEVVAVDCQ